MVFLLTLIGLEGGGRGWWAGFFFLHQATLMLALNGKKGKPVEVDLVEFLFHYYNRRFALRR